MNTTTRPTAELKLHETLASLVAASGYSGEQKKLAGDIGVSVSCISQYLSGRSRPSLGKLVALAKVLDVSMDYLLTGARREETAQPDYGSAIHYIDHALARLQEKTDAQTRIVGLLTDVLAAKLKTEADRLATRGAWQGGIITDDELLTMERYSRESSLVLMNLDSQIVVDGGREAAGPFLEIVAQNLRDGHTYRVLLPSHANEWKSLVNRCRELLQQLCPHQGVLRNIVFRKTKVRVIGGYGLYRFDVDALQKHEPVKYFRFQEWITDGTLGYVIAASRSLQANSLMDTFHLQHALKSFELAWKEAQSM